MQLDYLSEHTPPVELDCLEVVHQEGSEETQKGRGVETQIIVQKRQVETEVQLALRQ